MTGLSEERAREVLYAHGDLMPRYETQVIAAMLAFAAEQQAGGWRRIESAPKDGTWILVWLGGVSQCADTVQWAYGGWWNGSTGHVRSEATPTHWQPLPAPPTEQARHD